VWRARSNEAFDDAFCEAVEQGTIDAKVGTWR
jgi:hypothetical protein